MIKSMRRLRRSLLSCETCSLLEECAYRSQFNAAVDAAILEVTEEWAVFADRLKAEGGDR
jgi:hypothetical protein